MTPPLPPGSEDGSAQTAPRDRDGEATPTGTGPGTFLEPVCHDASAEAPTLGARTAPADEATLAEATTLGSTEDPHRAKRPGALHLEATLPPAPREAGPLWPGRQPPRPAGEDDDDDDTAPGEGATLSSPRATYHLRGLLGTGGFGQVYRAERLEPADGGPADEVALKLFLPPRRGPAERGARRELAALLSLRHPRIPPLLDQCLEPPRPFVVFPYYRRGNLEANRERFPGPPPEVVARLLGDLLEALVAAHARSILHLDIKPANVLVDDDDRFLLADFGIAQGMLVPWSVTHPGVGTPGYQSPEQGNLVEDAVDVRTDLWGVGVTAWSFATGRPLRGRLDVEGLLRAGRSHSLPPVRTLRPDFPPELDLLLHSLVALDPAARPGGAAEVLARLASLEAGGGVPTEAARDGGGPSFGREATGSSPGRPATTADLEALRRDLFDDMWITLLGRGVVAASHLRTFEAGDLLAREGDRAHHAFVLLRGRVVIEREGRRLAVEDREGTFLGEVAAFTGGARTATMRAESPVTAVCFNAAEFERFIARHPPLGVRLIRELAARVARESSR